MSRSAIKITTYQKHIDELSEKLNCKVMQELNMPGMMYVEFGYIEGPIIKEQKDYLLLLHELGHFYHGHTQGRPPKESEKFYFENGVLKSEAQAWNYALDNAIDTSTTESREFMWYRCLGSYYTGYLLGRGNSENQLWNGDRHYIKFAYDEPDEYFWKTKRRIFGSNPKEVELVHRRKVFSSEVR